MTTNDGIKQKTKAHTQQVSKQSSIQTQAIDRSINSSKYAIRPTIRAKWSKQETATTTAQRDVRTKQMKKERKKWLSLFHQNICSLIRYILLKLNVRAERYTDLTAIICSSRISGSGSDGDNNNNVEWHEPMVTTNFKKRSNRTRFGQYVTTFNFIMQIWMLGAHAFSALCLFHSASTHDSIHLLFSFIFRFLCASKLAPGYSKLPSECKLLRIQRKQNRNPQRSRLSFFNTFIGNVMHRHQNTLPVHAYTMKKKNAKLFRCSISV